MSAPPVVVTRAREEFGIPRGRSPKLAKPISYVIEPNGCHRCTSHIPAAFGYPRIMINGRAQSLTRAIYVARHGVLARGLCVRHRCDNPPCINLDHLESGTPIDNCRDMFTRGRRSGTMLDERTIAHIKADRTTPVAILATVFGVCLHTIYAMHGEKSWRHVAAAHSPDLAQRVASHPRSGRSKRLEFREPRCPLGDPCEAEGLADPAQYVILAGLHIRVFTLSPRDHEESLR